jgi:opacity protein-like surface antigen
MTRTPVSRASHSALLLAAAALAFASPARAADPGCPPGSWFCADTQSPTAPPSQPMPPAKDEPKGLEPLPAATEAQPAKPAPQQAPVVVVQQAPPPPVVVYQPPPPVVVREEPPAYVYHPRPAASIPARQEWGLNLHLEGAMMGHGAAQNAGMGGAGLGLRYRPLPGAALEANFDVLGGNDYQGQKRQESAFSLNALLFVNPRSKAQVYFLAGFGWSWAHVGDDSDPSAQQWDYHYFGGQVGAGLELRLARHFALNADVRGFLRARTDDAAQYQPEYVDSSTGRTTNTSGGGLITGGMTFYF